MADDVLLPATGTGTADVSVATDQVSDGAHYQLIKLADGTLNETTPIEGGWARGHFGLLVEDKALRRVLEEFLVATVEAQPSTRDVPHAISSGHVNVTNVPTPIAANTGRGRLLVVNYQTVSIYVGDQSVSTTNGFLLATGAALTLDTAAPIYGITTSTYTAASEDVKVHFLQTY